LLFDDANAREERVRGLGFGVSHSF
jgi:hypothetical protein